MAHKKSQKKFDEDQAKLGVEPLHSPNKDYSISVTINLPYPVNDKYEEQGALEKMEEEMEEKMDEIKDAVNANGIGISQDKDHW
jgi:hypothetical protein